MRDAVHVKAADPAALKATGRGAAWRLLEVEAGAPGYLGHLETPMNGRSEELGRLRQSFERTAEERAVHCLRSSGLRGSSESRLAEALVELARRAGASLRGRSLSSGKGSTFWPLREVVSQVNGDGVAGFCR